MLLSNHYRLRPGLGVRGGECTTGCLLRWVCRHDAKLLLDAQARHKPSPAATELTVPVATNSKIDESFQTSTISHAWLNLLIINAKICIVFPLTTCVNTTFTVLVPDHPGGLQCVACPG
jgi:hypothetical protein